MSAAPLGRRQTRAALPATPCPCVWVSTWGRGVIATPPMPSARRDTIRTCMRLLYVLDNQAARESRTIVAGSEITPPLPTDLINPGLLDGLIAAEQILRATRGADEKRPSSRDSHGTCAAGSRPARGPRSRADPFLRSRKPTFRSGARDRQARSKRCRDGAALRVPPATCADSLLLARLRGDVVHDVIRAC
jgi:hypothetical protein